MKYIELSFFCCFWMLNGWAQHHKVKLFIEAGAGLSNFTGKGAENSSYMVGTAPIENDYTNNPYGKKVKTSYAVGVTGQYPFSKKNNITGSLEYQSLGSKIRLDGVSYPLRPSIIHPATGSTKITTTEITLGLSYCRKTGEPESHFPFVYLGMAYSLVTKIQENGRAIDYTVTGEHVSNVDHRDENLNNLQAQAGFMFDISKLRLGFQYRRGITSIENVPLNDGSKFRTQSFFFKFAYCFIE